MADANNVEGLVSIPSKHSVDETVIHIVSLLREKNIKLFAVVDHSGEAKAAGLTMPATRLVIFGNPKGGTPLMLASPSVAIDLPLKLLVAENNSGDVTISYNSAEYLGKRHQLPENLLANIAVIAGLAKAAAE
jgi:uncharacterized protein (DUF302 family)